MVMQGLSKCLSMLGGVISKIFELSHSDVLELADRE